VAIALVPAMTVQIPAVPVVSMDGGSMAPVPVPVTVVLVTSNGPPEATGLTPRNTITATEMPASLPRLLRTLTDASAALNSL